jgi:hypothetical protein
MDERKEKPQDNFFKLDAIGKKVVSWERRQNGSSNHVPLRKN